METLISPQEVIDIAFPANPRIRPATISHSKIIVAQERFIRPALGKIYQKLPQASFAAFVEEYIKPSLAFFVKFSVIDEIAIAISDDGVHLNAYEEKGYETQQNLSKNSESKSTKNNSGSQTKSSTVTGKNSGVETATADLEKNTNSSKTDNSEVTKEEAFISSGKTEKKTSDTLEQKGNTQTLTDRETRSVGTNSETLSATVTKNDSSTKTDTGIDTTTVTKNDNSNTFTVQKNTGSDNGSETSNSNTSKEHDSQSHKTETQDNTSSSSGTDVTASVNEETRDDHYTGTAQKRNIASDYQRNLLKKQAYTDAKILLGVAIRHINANKEAFGLPAYKSLKNYQTVY